MAHGSKTYSKEVKEAIRRKHGFDKKVCPRCKIKNPPSNTSCRKCNYSFKHREPIRTKNEEPEG